MKIVYLLKHKNHWYLNFKIISEKYEIKIKEDEALKIISDYDLEVKDSELWLPKDKPSVDFHQVRALARTEYDKINSFNKDAITWHIWKNAFDRCWVALSKL